MIDEYVQTKLVIFVYKNYQFRLNNSKLNGPFYFLNLNNKHKLVESIILKFKLKNIILKRFQIINGNYQSFF